jgi:hypothetical protein
MPALARMNGVSCSRRFARGARAAGGEGADHRILGLEGAVAAFAHGSNGDPQGCWRSPSLKRIELSLRLFREAGTD